MNNLFFGKPMVKVRKRIKLKITGKIVDEKVDDEKNEG